MARAPLYIFRAATDTYTATEVLGGGGAGRVYLAHDEEGGEHAVKLIDPDKLNTQRRKRFRNELTFGLTNTHPNILTIIESGALTTDKGDAPFYVMPRYASTLRDKIKAGLPAADVLGVFASILLGVDAAHKRGIYHRDLKPENILMAADGRPVVADFGIAHFEEDELFTLAHTKDSDRLANFNYAAPEQCAGGGAVDARADIYALGMMLNEMFTGALPRGVGFRRVAAAHSDYAYVDDVVDVMMQHDPANRPASVEAVQTLLRRHSDEFAVRQRISAIDGTVIGDTEIDDPLVRDPVRLVDTDYRNGTLYLILSQPVNREWEICLLNLFSFPGVPVAHPPLLTFDKHTATIPIPEGAIQMFVDTFKQWLATANAHYKSVRVGELIQERADLETSARVRRSLKI